MHELVLLLSDLYFSDDSPELAPEGAVLPGLQQIVRFGTRSRSREDWRASLSGLLGQAPQQAPATVAAMAVAAVPQAPVAVGGGHVWIATPVHMLAGLTTLHLDRRGILRLAQPDAAALAQDFAQVFSDSPFRLLALPTGELLLSGPDTPGEQAVEPARLMGGGIAEAQRMISGKPGLRGLAAEMEMWLHGHVVNAARRQRGELPLTGLWLWGGGPWPTPAASLASGAGSTERAFGREAFVAGLWQSKGLVMEPLPARLPLPAAAGSAGRAVLVLEIAPLLQANAHWTFGDALTNMDRTFLAPAVAALRQRGVQQLRLLANDRQFVLKSRDLLKFWRRAAPGLAGLG